MNVDSVPFEGVPMTIGGRDFMVPALSLKQVRALRQEIESLTAIPPGGAITDKQIETTVSLVHAALSRNYPALTLDQVFEMIDLRNMGSFINAITGATLVAAKEPANG